MITIQEKFAQTFLATCSGNTVKIKILNCNLRRNE